MNYKLFDRIVAIILYLLGIAVAVLAILYALNIFDPLQLSAKINAVLRSGDYGNYFSRTIVIILSLGFIYLFLRLLFVREKSGGKGSAPSTKQGILVRNAETGEIYMTQSALQYLVDQRVRGFAKVRDCQSNVILGEDSIQIQLQISAMADGSIPEISSELQTDLKSYIESTTGIAVESVQVLVIAPNKEKEHNSSKTRVS